MPPVVPSAEYFRQVAFVWCAKEFIAPDTYQPATRLLKLAHTICIMIGLSVMTFKQRGQTIEGPISLNVAFFFGGSIGPVVQVSKIFLPAYIDRFR
jgi:hypothetical protein